MRHVRPFQSSGGDTPTRNLTEDAPLVDTPDHLYRHRSRPHCTTPPAQPATATATDTSTATATATPVRHHSHHPPPWPPQLPMSLPPPPLKTPPPPRTRRAGSPAVAFTKLAPHQKEIIRRPPTAAARRGRLWSPNSKDRIRLWFHLSTRPGTSLHSVPPQTTPPPPTGHRVAGHPQWWMEWGRLQRWRQPPGGRRGVGHSGPQRRRRRPAGSRPERGSPPGTAPR